MQSGVITDKAAAASYITIWSGGAPQVNSGTLKDAAGNTWVLQSYYYLDHYGCTVLKNGAVAYANAQLAVLLTVGKDGKAWIQQAPYAFNGPGALWFSDTGTGWKPESAAPYAISFQDVPIFAQQVGYCAQTFGINFASYTSMQQLIDNKIIDVNNTKQPGFMLYTNNLGDEHLVNPIWKDWIQPPLPASSLAFENGALIIKDQGNASPTSGWDGLWSICVTDFSPMAEITPTNQLKAPLPYVGTTFGNGKYIKLKISFDMAAAADPTNTGWIAGWFNSLSNFLAVMGQNFLTQRSSEWDILEVMPNNRAPRQPNGPIFNLHDYQFLGGTHLFDFVNPSNAPNRSDIWGAPDFFKNGAVFEAWHVPAAKNGGVGYVKWAVSGQVVADCTYSATAAPPAGASDESGSGQNGSVPGTFMTMDTNPHVLMLNAGHPNWPLTIYDIEIWQTSETDAAMVG